MSGMDERFVVVNMSALSDLLELVERAAERLDAIQPHDALATCLRGVAAEVKTHSLLEPA